MNDKIGSGASEKVNVLLVDDQPDKLLSYEVILGQLGENLIKTSSAREALQFLLKNDVAVVLIDVCMPDLDGFQLAAMIRDHPRFSKTAIIFISAIHLTEMDRLRGYEMGAVDYVPVPVVPEVLRAKVRVFAELFRKTRELERLNSQLERRVAERTAELEASNARLMQAEQGRSLALAAGQMGSWDWDLVTDEWTWDEGTYRIFGVDPQSFKISADSYSRTHSSRRLAAAARGRSGHGGRRPHAAERVSRRAPKRRHSLVHRHRGGERRCNRQYSAHLRRYHRRHRPQGGRGAPGPLGPGGRSSRPQCACRDSIHHQAHARYLGRRICPGHRGPHQGAGARSHFVVRFALERRGSGDPGRRRIGALPGRRQNSMQGPRHFAAAGNRARAWRWRCTNSPPMRPSTARCRRRPARSSSIGISSPMRSPCIGWRTEVQSSERRPHGISA